MLEHYTGLVEMEVLCLKDMILQHVLPACNASNSCDKETSERLASAANMLVEKALELEEAPDVQTAAKLAHALRFGSMEHVRTLCDETENSVKNELWTLATYKEVRSLGLCVTAAVCPCGPRILSASR